MKRFQLKFVQALVGLERGMIKKTFVELFAAAINNIYVFYDSVGTSVFLFYVSFMLKLEVFL